MKKSYLYKSASRNKMNSNYNSLEIAARNNDAISGLTHNFYRYPARFSPVFAREVIKLFSNPGDLVVDPFVGGGTTLVEASNLGRLSIGIDINSLATFITKVKTTPLTEAEIENINDWKDLARSMTIRNKFSKPSYWKNQGYLKNLNDSKTWRIRNLISIYLSSLSELPEGNVKNFIKCAILKTSQWALDTRLLIPSIEDFRLQLSIDISEMLEGMIDYTSQLEQVIGYGNIKKNQYFVTILNRSTKKIEQEEALLKHPPKLILTSPPYPGVHVLYHRWQIKGRRETAAPYWIIGQMDGNGAAYYTLGDRKTHQKSKYFDEMQEVFNSLSLISDENTTLVQLIAFSDPCAQLPRYLRRLENAGFEEIFLTNKKTHKRVWRSVPNRKWYADIQGKTASSREVVLIHKKVSNPKYTNH